MSWYGPNPGNCFCTPPDQCNGTYTILDKYMLDWAVSSPPKVCCLTWLVEVSRPSEWRIWATFNGITTLQSTGTLSGTPGGELIQGPSQGTSSSIEPNPRILYELEIKFGLDGICEWFKIDECWFTIPFIEPIPGSSCRYNYLPEVLTDQTCIFAGDVQSITVTQPAISVTVAGYPAPYAAINNTYVINGGARVDVNNNPSHDPYWRYNSYIAVAQFHCNSVMGLTESTHRTASAPGYPAFGAYYWKRRTLYWTDVNFNDLIINQIECVPCLPDEIHPIILGGKDGTKATTNSTGGYSNNPAWFPPPAHPLDPSGTVTLNE